MHFGKKEEGPMSEKTCRKKWFGEALEMCLHRWSGQKWLSGQQGKL